MSYYSEYGRGRPLRTAFLASVLWHLIWLFVIVIDVSDPRERVKLDPKIYFVGPILTDDAFNLILASKPELSRTTYRSQGEEEPELEPQPQSISRSEPGDLVSVPLGRTTWASFRDDVDEMKPYPKQIFDDRLVMESIARPFEIDPAFLSGRNLLTAPKKIPLPKIDEALSDPEFELTVTGAGRVTHVRVVLASGHDETDRALIGYLKDWQFVPLQDYELHVEQKDVLKVPLEAFEKTDVRG